MLSSSLSMAQAGSLDSTFGYNGIRLFQPGFRDNYAYGLTVMPNDDIFVSGRDWDGYSYGVGVQKNGEGLNYGYFPLQFEVPDYRNPLFLVAQPDGKLLANATRFIVNFITYPYMIIDSTFGIKGTTTFPLYEKVARVRSDGKIIIGGSTSYSTNNFVFTLLNENGSIDSSFGKDGITVTDFGGTALLTSIAVQADNKIIAGGYFFDYNNSTKKNIVLIRYNENGSVDSSFANNGILMPLSGDLRTASPILVLQNDGKIVVGGTLKPSTDSSDLLLLRLKINGEYDSSFGTNGILVTDIDQSTDYIGGVAVNAEGKIVVGSTTYKANVYSTQMCLLKYNSDGTFDSSFGHSGKVNSFFTQCSGIALQSDGKILVVGTGYGYYYSAYLLARFRVDGGPLPISLTSFTAEKKERSVLLKWQTSSEINNAYYAVERSGNSNINFTTIGNISRSSNSSQLMNYSYEDIVPLQGKNYYRLKQVDLDGKITYSKIILMDFSKIKIIKLYPNPVKDILTIEGLNETGSNNISIVNMAGRVLLRASFEGSTYNWNINQLPSGSYYLIVDSDKKITSLKFIKQ